MHTLEQEFPLTRQQQLVTVRVAEKRVEAEGICSFELRHPEGHALPAFSAGAHIDVQVAPGLVRQYSLCNSPRDSMRYLIGVLKEPAGRGGSLGMHDGIHEGGLLRISAPKNNFPLVPSRKTLLLAGGIGITPLLSMAEQLSSDHADFSLHYCVRSRARAAFLDRIEAARFRGSVHLHVDDAPSLPPFDPQAILRNADPDTHLYVCGPAGFVAHLTGIARDAGWPAAQVHVEYFAAPVQASSSQAGGTAENAEFRVHLAGSGRTYPIRPDQSIVDALGEYGVDIPVSCKEGVCGTCLTRVLDGQVDHRDYYLTQAEQALHDQMLPCCSRAKGGLLVLDL